MPIYKRLAWVSLLLSVLLLVGCAETPEITPEESVPESSSSEASVMETEASSQEPEPEEQEEEPEESSEIPEEEPLPEPEPEPETPLEAPAVDTPETVADTAKTAEAEAAQPEGAEVQKSGTSPNSNVGAGTVIEGNTLSQLVYDVITLINEERAAVGIDPLLIDNSLLEATRIRANECISHRNYGHTRPDGTNFDTVFDETGYGPVSYWGENILLVSNLPTAEEIVSFWRESEGHYRNYMNPNYKYCNLVFLNNVRSRQGFSGVHLFAG